MNASENLALAQLSERLTEMRRELSENGRTLGALLEHKQATTDALVDLTQAVNLQRDELGEVRKEQGVQSSQLGALASQLQATRPLAARPLFRWATGVALAGFLMVAIRVLIAADADQRVQTTRIAAVESWIRTLEADRAITLRLVGHTCRLTANVVAHIQPSAADAEACDSLNILAARAHERALRQ